MCVVKVTWLDRQHAGDRDLAGAAAVAQAARSVDCPYRAPWTVARFAGLFRHGWDGEPPDIAVARNEQGRVAGVLAAYLTHRDNRHLAVIDIAVDPYLRRRGIGRLLFQAGVDHARDHGRTVLVVPLAGRPENDAFAVAMDLHRAAEEVHRRQDLLALDWQRLDAGYAAALSYSAGYELIPIAGAVPADLVDDIAHLAAAINDAPTGDLDIEDEAFTTERIRAFEAAMAARHIRTYRLVARDRKSGALAGHTVVGLDGEQPWYGDQFDTSVLREHRGHRLGLLLKIGMLRWLADAEPQLRVLDTSNMASNSHMIKVNGTLGYRVVGSTVDWQCRINAAGDDQRRPLT